MGWSEVEWTTAGDAWVERGVAAVLIGAAVVGPGVALVHVHVWWQVLLWVAVELVLLLVGLGLWWSPEENLRATARLEASGVPARAQVLSAERLSDEDTVVHLLALRIAPPGGEAFEVAHRCRHHRCRAVAADTPPGELTALVDPTHQTWAVRHS